MYAAEGDVQLLQKHLGKSKLEWHNPADGGKTALIKAAEQRHLACVNTLLQAGADCNAVDDEGCSALFRAAARGVVSVVEALLKVPRILVDLANNVS